MGNLFKDAEERNRRAKMGLEATPKEEAKAKISRAIGRAASAAGRTDRCPCGKPINPRRKTHCNECVMNFS